MVFVALKTDILKQLCSEDQLELLDAVDGLRSQGIDSYVSLPQIIVCGDQSSGKSSVLEAISGVPFPVNSSLCTRFPTELVLRKTTEIGVSISIVPDLSHGESQDRTLSFQEKLENVNELPQLIEKAKAAMAITTTGKSFSKDLLRIEISGPDRPHLTIVDLPGLIHSETKQQSALDIELVKDVVRKYMEERRSIILAVISAKNDYANQIVLKLARAADKEGKRTLGVITKPDTLVPGSNSEETFAALAQNEDVNFRLGWHVLKNLDSDIGAGSLTKRDLEEQEFFSRGIWRTLPNACLGIETLRERLSALLLAQIATELPSLMREINGKLQLSQTQLERLGVPRITQEEQRLYLIQLSELYQSITKAAVDGSYNHAFFGDAKSDVGYQKRLRAVIQNLNGSFANTIVERGHRYDITDTSAEASGTGPVAISRVEYMDLVEQLIERTRGRELPGTYNPMIIADLFAEQSQPWEAIVMQHSEAVTQAVENFLRHLVGHIADKTTYEQLFRAVFEPALQGLVETLNKKLSELLAEHQKGHPITYNRQFTEAVDGLSEERLEQKITSIIIDKTGVTSLEQNSCHTADFRPLLRSLVEYTKPILTRPACSRALDCMEAYYKIALTRFIDDVSVEAVEASMMSKLHEILRPGKVAMMAAHEVTKMAGESQKDRNRRLELQTQIAILTGGIKTCKRIVSIGLPDSRSTKVLLTSRRDLTPETEEQPEPDAVSSVDEISSGEEVVVIEPEEDVPEAPQSFSDENSLVEEQPIQPVDPIDIFGKKKGKKKPMRKKVVHSDD